MLYSQTRLYCLFFLQIGEKNDNVPLEGIEPPLQVPETYVLSIELQRRIQLATGAYCTIQSAFQRVFVVNQFSLRGGRLAKGFSWLVDDSIELMISWLKLGRFWITK